MVEKMNVEKYPSVPLCKFGNYCQFNISHFIKLWQEIHWWGKYLLLHRELFALPLSVVLTAPPKTLLGSSFSAKFLLEVLKQVLFRHTSAACPWGFPETDRQTDSGHVVWQNVQFCQAGIKGILVAKPMVWTLSSHWMLEWPSLHFYFLSVQAQQITHHQ